MITVDKFAEELGFTVIPEGETEDLQRVLDTALAVCISHSPPDLVNPLPPGQQAALDTAQLRAALELWRWQQANAGNTMYADGQDFPQPVYRDVYFTVQPLLTHAGLVVRGMA